ncbi:hypothetical protein ECZU29_61990 [Escherichia coli]|nr:hypothetical protein ECZU29_61990 [Escherichia coli]
MLHVLGPFRREGGIERDLQHTQQLVLGSLASAVVFLHWLTKPTKAAAGIGPANRKPLHRVATRLPQPRKAVGCFHTLGYHLHCRFQKTAALNVRSRLHYSSGGVDPSGNDGCCRPSADAGRTFRNRPFDAAPMAFAQG